MTDIDIDAIRQREHAATEGPWKTGDRFGNRSLGSSVVVLAGNLPPARLDPHRNGRNDAVFIAHARTDVPALLAKVDELTAERDAACALSVELLRDKRHLDDLTAELNATRTSRDEEAALAAQFREQLTAANRRADGLEADLRSAVTANTAWANQGKPCLIVTCLECGEKYEYDGGVVHFSALDEAQSMAEDDDWRRVGDQFVCADCIHKPHTFTPDGLDALTCQRCDLEEDDHETAPAVVTVELPAEAVAR